MVVEPPFSLHASEEESIAPSAPASSTTTPEASEEEEEAEDEDEDAPIQYDEENWQRMLDIWRSGQVLWIRTAANGG